MINHNQSRATVGLFRLGLIDTAGMLNSGSAIYEVPEKYHIYPERTCEIITERPSVEQ